MTHSRTLVTEEHEILTYTASPVELALERILGNEEHQKLREAEEIGHNLFARANTEFVKYAIRPNRQTAINGIALFYECAIDNLRLTNTSTEASEEGIILEEISARTKQNAAAIILDPTISKIYVLTEGESMSPYLQTEQVHDILGRSIIPTIIADGITRHVLGCCEETYGVLRDSTLIALGEYLK